MENPGHSPPSYLQKHSERYVKKGEGITTTNPIQQRYLNHVKGLNTRFGKNVLNPINKFYYPTTTQMNKFDKYHIPYDIDPAIRSPIIALNEHGYSTYTSCQGHNKGGEGWININPHESEISPEYLKGLPFRLSKKRINQFEVNRILSNFGIQVKKFRKARYPKQTHHLFIFNAIEGYEGIYGPPGKR